MADAKSEAYEIKRSGGVPQKNSGRGKHQKGDFTLAELWLVDIKEYSKSYSISKENWAKVCTDAFKSGHYRPALKIVLGDDGSPKTRLWVISDEDMQEYVELKERYG